MFLPGKFYGHRSLVGYSRWGRKEQDMPEHTQLCTFSYFAVPLLSGFQPFGTPWAAAARLPGPSLFPGICSNSYSLSRWCHPTTSSSVASFSSCPQSFPASGSFPMNWLFVSGGQSTGASASVPPKNNQDWFPLGLTGLVFLQSKGLESSPAPQFESINSSVLSLLYGPTLTSIYD